MRSEVAKYQSPQTEETKIRIPVELENGQLLLELGTISLGMGIDVTDIRRTVHVTPPSSPENCKEIARLSRDKLEEDAIMYYSAADLLAKHIN